MLEENIKRMGDVNQGMDIVIVSTSSKAHEEFWQNKLTQSQGLILKKDALFFVVEEDWEGGAGNGLGTLYAFLKAQKRAIQQGIDILAKLKAGASVALYHTAGQGKRLYPLTASENNNKPAVKLPSLLKRGELMSMLEATIKQTSIYANSRKGRLSVFWGDQLFIPSNSPDYTPKNHIDILAIMRNMPTQQEWEAAGLENYGLLTINQAGEAQCADKTNYLFLETLIHEGKLSGDKIGTSLGSFSLSYMMLEALLELFQKELVEKIHKMDSDPFIWMPMTLDPDTYVALMEKKEAAAEFALEHFERIQHFKNEFMAKHSHLTLFGAIDVGHESQWWDYGTVQSYFSNNYEIIRPSLAGKLMRLFFQIPTTPKMSNIKIDQNSCLVNCDIGSGQIKNSLLVNVKADHLDIEDTLILNSNLASLKARHALVYNTFDEKPFQLVDNGVRADVSLAEDQHIKLQTKLTRDGKEDWKIKLPGNAFSYEEITRIQANSVTV